MIYITDGSFEGILTAIFEAYKRKEEPESIISKDNYQMSFLTESMEIETDGEKSGRVYRAVINKMSVHAMEELYCAYLSGHPDAGLAIYRYVRIGLKAGSRVVSYLQNADVLKVHDMSRRVLTEVHRFLGILRFRKLKNGIYYARYEPDSNITMLLSDHFAERLSDQPWIIHDARRDIYALYNTDEVVLTNERLPINDEINDDGFEALWKCYFKSIAIKSRYNPKLQRQYMPRRYWKNLIEKQI